MHSLRNWNTIWTLFAHGPAVVRSLRPWQSSPSVNGSQSPRRQNHTVKSGWSWKRRKSACARHPSTKHWNLMAGRLPTGSTINWSTTTRARKGRRNLIKTTETTCHQNVIYQATPIAHWPPTSWIHAQHGVSTLECKIIDFEKLSKRFKQLLLASRKHAKIISAKFPPASFFTQMESFRGFSTTLLISPIFIQLYSFLIIKSPVFFWWALQQSPK